MKNQIQLIYSVCKDAIKGNGENEKLITTIKGNDIYLRVSVGKGGKCLFSYSVDGKMFEKIEEEFQAEAGKWIGAKVGLFCSRSVTTNDSGYADFDWFRISAQ
jgi:Beta xylosidase C-terminal Concanavalin A-like domain